MASPKIQVAPELVAEGQRLYETTMTTIGDIAALMGADAAWRRWQGFWPGSEAARPALFRRLAIIIFAAEYAEARRLVVELAGGILIVRRRIGIVHEEDDIFADVATDPA
jgi:hypothetical protein